VLRSAAPEGAAGAAGTAPPVTPASPAATRPKPGGGRNRRWLLIVGVLVLVGAIVGIVIAVSGGGGNSPKGAAGSHGASTSNSAPVSGGGSTSTSRTAKPPTPTFAAISPELAHRGDHDGYPQETIPAFVQAAQHGFTTETDVRWSKDGVALITHDDATGRGMVCTGGPLTVADTTWQVLHSQCRTSPSAARTNKSYGIPTFDDTVHQISKVPGATLFAEIKVDQTAAQNDQFLAILQKWNMVSRTVVTSFVSPYLVNFDKAATKAAVDVRTLLFASVNQPTTVAALRQAKVWGVVFQEDWDKIPTLMPGAKRAGIHVGISDVAPPAPGDGPTQWAQAKSLGAEFVLTDHPSAHHTWLQQQ
jgi:glycerophosphoryl diester phosphodiesterase